MAGDVITHAQTIMSNGVLVPPHEIEHPARWYYKLSKIENYYYELCSNGVIFIPNFMKIHSSVSELLYGRNCSV
jgi:hypothetical protein